ncbi:hypothetical protein FOA52_000461 [Chlamydomonas sp. UWO 241]|nr:hypothetical protein FOA52_000461 [Chlamydomonas sp. UWO 241]
MSSEEASCSGRVPVGAETCTTPRAFPPHSMRRKLRAVATHHWLLAALIALLLLQWPTARGQTSPPPPSPSPPPPSPAGYVALLHAKSQLTDPNSELSTWTGTDPCSGPWLGITCSGGSEPTALSLNSLSLGGNLPDALSSVTSLSNLDLGGNAFSGALPGLWAALTGLTKITLDSNGLTGSVPAAWSRLSNLKFANLAYNGLTSTLPSAWPSGMAALTRLIATGNAAMCGTLPSPWTAAVVAYGSTLVGGDCPATTGLLSVKSAVTSTWPSYFTGWETATDPCNSWTGVTCTNSRVTGLDLSYREFQGTLPAALSKTVHLTSLNLASNK